MSTETGRPAAAASLTYLPQLDGLRGFVVALVVIYHSAYLTAGWGPRPFPGGFIGVDLFFALSGFLITSLLLAEVERTGRVDFRQFWSRRIRRLVPALVVAVVGVTALVWIFGDHVDGEALRNSGIGSVLFFSNWQQAWGWPYQFELSHTWSLAVEAQFYLVWPVVIIVFAKLRIPRAVFVAITLAAVVVVSVHRWQMWTGPTHFLPLYIRTDTRADVILLGCLGAMAVSWGWFGPATGKRLRVPAVVALGVILYICLDFATSDSRLYHGWFSIVGVSCATLVVAAVLDPDWVLNRWWRQGWLMVLGQRSYSLYLWHVPIFILVAQHLGDRPVWLRLVVALVPTAIITECSYRFVEMRYRHLRKSS